MHCLSNERRVGDSVVLVFNLGSTFHDDRFVTVAYNNKLHSHLLSISDKNKTKKILWKAKNHW